MTLLAYSDNVQFTVTFLLAATFGVWGGWSLRGAVEEQWKIDRAKWIQAREIARAKRRHPAYRGDTSRGTMSDG